MDNYTLMRMSADMDDDALEAHDFEEEEAASDAEEEYFSFYDDLKRTTRDDW